MTAAITMGSESTVARIDAVDAFARNLYLRLRQSTNAGSDPALDEVAVAVRQLHLALRHLRVEATDQDSLLNRAASTSLYVRQLEPLIDDCSFQLQQLDTALATLDIQGSSRAERLATLRTKLANEKMSVDMFLDTVQLHDPSKQPVGIVDGSQSGLENIKDKVDAIAAKLFTRRGDDCADDEDQLWQEFKSELEKEGFSPQVLRRHKEVLRAYIRELETMSQQNGGAPPTVRGLLEHEAKSQPSSPKEILPAFENEKYPTSMHNARRMPNAAPLVHQNPSLPPRHLSMADHRGSISSEDSVHSDGGDSMALISTRDLVAIEHLNNGMANMHLQAPSHHYGSSPNQRLLGSSAPSSFPGISELAGSPGSNLMSSSPASTALPPYSSPQLPPYSSQRPSFRLAPDTYGNEIPMDAPWTKVRGRLISQEVLNRHGRRFEARPEYIAILGRLSREEIAEYVRESVECRASRSRRYGHRSSGYPPEKRRSRADSKSSHDDDGSHSSGESDTTDLNDDKTSPKGTKSYPYIVNFPEKEKGKTSPAATSQPKSILKNKNENHVKFDLDEPYEVEAKPNRSPPKSERERERDRRSKRYYDDSLRDDDRSRRYSREPDGRPRRRSLEDRDRPRRSDRRDRDQDRDRPRDRAYRDREYRDREYRDRDRDRADRDRYRDDERKEDKVSKKKAWGETLGAVGIGGAAVSLLGVLAEAATGI